MFNVFLYTADREHKGLNQARNHLGTPGGAKSFLRGAQNLYTMSNSFKLYVQHIFPGERKILQRLLLPARSLVTGLG